MSEETYRGLSASEVKASREKFGTNVLVITKPNILWDTLREIVFQPMFILLASAALIYYLIGQPHEATIMIIAISLVSAISIYQENKSRKAINALKKLSSPKAKVIRERHTLQIASDDIVIGDLIVVEDGYLVPADAEVIEIHDFTVNESILTGEALPVNKNLLPPDNIILQGTMVMTGSCVAKVIAISSNTVFGKIGKTLQTIEVTKTPLQLQIKSFVTRMAWTGFGAFIIVWGVYYYLSKSILQGFMHGLTMAMSVLPEEIPVAFSTFMALGAYQLYKSKVIARNPHTVEALGAASVICTDKTGTITENRMTLSAIYDFATDTLFDFTTAKFIFNPVLEYAMWASETTPFDAMEKAIHEAYSLTTPLDKRPAYKLIHEYPLSGNPPIMTHVFSDQHTSLIAVKGSVEGVLKQCRLSEIQKNTILEKTKMLASKGYRVLGVAKSDAGIDHLPHDQHGFVFDFLGLVAFYDPPKKNISDILRQFYNAGLKIKLITGDFSETAIAISHQINFQIGSGLLTGTEVMKMDAKILRQRVKDTNIFARMFPEAKLKVIEALKENGEIVAMTGDGVNDGPALKAAHIGIAMGLRGSEIAKQASSLVLMDDDLVHMVEAIAQGRRIYENLKKAIQYIISIHIPIILIIMLPVLLSWTFTDFFLPIHVIFLELIMGPTCSIVFAREPIESDSMQKAPRKLSSSLFAFSELFISIIQGVVITIFSLGIGYYYMHLGQTESQVRTAIYTTLIFSNIFLTLVNRSFHFSIFTTLRYKNSLLPLMILITLAVGFLFIYYPLARDLFQFSALTNRTLVTCFGAAFVSVMWIEIYKLVKRHLNQSIPDS